MEEKEYRSTEIQDILTRPPHWMLRWGNGILILLVILFLLFTWFIRYPDIISSEALITSPIPPQKEYARSSGKIESLLVSDNSYVEQGEILAMLENTANLDDVLLLQQIIDTIDISQMPFRFPLDELPTLSLGELVSSYALFEQDYIEYSLSLALDPLSNKLSSKELSQSQLYLRLNNMEAQKTIDDKKIELARNEFERNEELYQKGVISLNEFEQKKLQFLEQEKNLRNLDLSISQVRQSITETSANTKELQITGKIEEARLMKNVIQSFIQMKEALKSWELKYVLRANRNGRVSFVDLWNEGQNVNQGDLLFTIVPEEASSFIARIKAPIRNSGKIKTGQRVNIKLFNYPEEEYGMLNATIASMSAIPSEEGFYLVQAELPGRLLTSYEIEIPFRSEMSGTAEIITEDLRLFERFFYQLRGIFKN